MIMITIIIKIIITYHYEITYQCRIRYALYFVRITTIHRSAMRFLKLWAITLFIQTLKTISLSPVWKSETCLYKWSERRYRFMQKEQENSFSLECVNLWRSNVERCWMTLEHSSQVKGWDTSEPRAFLRRSGQSRSVGFSVFTSVSPSSATVMTQHIRRINYMLSSIMKWPF